MISEAVTATAMQVRLIFYVCLLVSIWGPAAVFAIDIPALVQKAKPAIVEIVTLDQQNNVLKTGTGFFISPDGMLLTNYHVISGGSSIMAKTPSGAVYFFKSFVSTSETNDVAELQFFATDVPYLTLGSSLSAVEGQRVLVIGNPEGLEGTVSDGIISAFRVGRTMIQITAPVSSGSSGSPVLDESGNVIGIATQVLKEGQNLNFAISAETIRDAIARAAAITPTPTPVVVVTPTPSVARISADGYYSRASEEFKKGNYQAAIADYTEAIRLKPDFADAFNDRGVVYLMLKQGDKALNDCTEAIRLKPNSPYFYTNRGTI
jgi:S1-C subfamily serine protease